MRIQDHTEQLPMFVSKLGHYAIVLQITWLQLHDVAVRFASNTVTFRSQYCTTHCHDAPITVQGVTEEPPEPVYHQQKGVYEPKTRQQQPFLGNISISTKSLFFQTGKKGKLKVFKASLYDIDKAIDAENLKERPLGVIVTIQYLQLLPTFNKVLANRLPPHRPGIARDVCLKFSKTPSWGPLYAMSRAELVVLKESLEENMSKGFIWQSSSHFAPPVLIAKKGDRLLRLCIHYHDTKSIPINNRMLLHLIRGTPNVLQSSRVYTQLDVRGSYKKLRVITGDEHKLGFMT